MNKNFESFIEFVSQKQFFGPVLTVLGAMLIYYIIALILDKMASVGKDELELKRKKTIFELVKSILKIVLFLIVVVVILNTLGIRMTTLLAGLGTISVVMSLALQDIWKDLVAGFTILLNNYYVIGDTVMFRDFKGEVISLGLRSTKIKKFTGEVMAINNRNCDVIINYSQKSSNHLFEIMTAYNVDLDKVEKLMLKIIPKIEKVENIVKNETRYLGVSEITADQIKHLLTVKCKRMTQYQVQRDVLKLLKKEFDANKIKISIS